MCFCYLLIYFYHSHQTKEPGFDYNISFRRSNLCCHQPSPPQEKVQWLSTLFSHVSTAVMTKACRNNDIIVLMATLFEWPTLWSPCRQELEVNGLHKDLPCGETEDVSQHRSLEVDRNILKWLSRSSEKVSQGMLSWTCQMWILYTSMGKLFT